MTETVTKPPRADRPPPSNPWGKFNRELATKFYEQYRPQARLTPSSPASSPSLPQAPTAPSAPSPQQAKAPPSLAQELVILARQAQNGDAASLKRLHQHLDGTPEIWKRIGDISILTELDWIAAIADEDLLLKESLGRRLRELKNELAEGTKTPLERLLVDLIGVTWLAANHAEMQAALSQGSLQQAVFRLKRAESAQRRYLGAIKTLAKVRNLLRRAGATTG